MVCDLADRAKILIAQLSSYFSSLMSKLNAVVSNRLLYEYPYGQYKKLTSNFYSV